MRAQGENGGGGDPRFKGWTATSSNFYKCTISMLRHDAGPLSGGGHGTDSNSSFSLKA